MILALNHKGDTFLNANHWPQSKKLPYKRKNKRLTNKFSTLF